MRIVCFITLCHAFAHFSLIDLKSQIFYYIINASYIQLIIFLRQLIFTMHRELIENKEKNWLYIRNRESTYKHHRLVKFFTMCFHF